MNSCVLGGTGAAENTNTRPSDAGQSQQKKQEVSFSVTQGSSHAGKHLQEKKRDAQHKTQKFISVEEKVQHSLEKE